MRNIIITIDGPAASGKEKIAKFISRKWKFKHLDSGLLYRKLAQILLNDEINDRDLSKIKKRIGKIKKISFQNSKKLRTQEISQLASKIAIHQFVRLYVNNLQYNFVNKHKKIPGFVIDGRDIGSVVFKKADLKLYIEVNSKIRAKRRYKQLIDSGEKSIYRKILKDIKLRDKKDKLRKNSPLIIPDKAQIINNNYSFKNTIVQINKLMENF